MDNVASHKTPAIQRWFAKRSRWHGHLTPRSRGWLPAPTTEVGAERRAWLNQVERFFANLTDKQLRRGVHRSTIELEAAICTYIERVNTHPKPVWTKSADAILASIKRCCLADPIPNRQNFRIRTLGALKALLKTVPDAAVQRNFGTQACAG